MNIVLQLLEAKLSPLADLAKVFHGTALATVLVWLFIVSLLKFDLAYDTIAYHLPFALKRAGWADFTHVHHLEELFASHPPLPHFLQSLMINATGVVNLAGSVDALSAAGTFFLLKWLYGSRLSMHWLLTLLCGIPLFLLHLHTGMVDLIANMGLLVGFAGLHAYCSGINPRKALTVLWIGLFVAMFSKFQLWPSSFVLSAFSGKVLFKKPVTGAKRWYVGLLFLTVLFWPARNVISFGNPTHPFPLPYAHLILDNPHGDKFYQYEKLENTPHQIRSLLGPARFLSSAFELNRFYLSNVEFRWTLEQWHEGESPHHRMGGWFILTSILLSLGLIWAFRARAIEPRSGCTFFVCVLLTSFIPQSHELRYWIFIPMTAALFVVLALSKLTLAKRVFIQAGAVFCAFYVAGTLVPRQLSLQTPAESAPAEAKLFWEKAHGKPMSTPVEVCGSYHLAVYWLGPTFKEYPVKACY